MYFVDVMFADDDLKRLYSDATYAPKGISVAIIRAFRKVTQYARDAKDERDLREWKSLHFEQLKGNRSHQHSLKLNDQFRLIVELEGTAPAKRVKIIAIEDYHK